MRVLYFGTYDPNYSRNRILIEGLRQNGVEVLECRDNSSGIKKFVNLFNKHREFRGKYDLMVVGFLGQQIVPFARLLTRKPLIFDAFLSLYDSNVFDRKTAKPRSLKACYYWLLDWLSMHLADIVLFDTEQHINYAAKEFSVNKNKFRRIWIGAQDDIFKPMPKPYSNNFQVVFHGSYIPLQGIQYILKATKLLENEPIKFLMIGNGQEKRKMINLSKELELKNVSFNDSLLPDQLVLKIAEADVCLGIFGNTQKAQRVIPNKVYECLAMEKPVITADTPAIRELFAENELMLVSGANPESLASAILKLKNNPDLRTRVAENGYKKFKRTASLKILGADLKKITYELK